MNTPVPIQHTQKPVSFNPRLTPDQEASLESQFSRAKTLHATDLEILAAEMGVDDKEVKTWYNERLAHWRREQGLSDFFGSI
ncbi:homeodomain-only protein-like [Diaphorina citri]|uniref:Homeodomain-only protein n=1 Tax=Diaphorina citri TaxID=121845 RepID=A0A1S3DGZ9_DIACI|nr:homeodomain-only protein-like [Diaphorina citri]KAI5749328.1 hypothetical protein M8J76_006480 [Diaphorina citri]KAI5756201.1 hypothetical protein M8J77_022944 [Diaphorina citri]